jgi:outer membrane receptor for ferrienterochelin and colicin
VRREQIQVTAEAEQFLQIRVPMEAIALGAIEVVAHSAAEEYRRRSGANVHLFTRKDIEAREAVARHVGEVIQGRVPGLMIQKEPFLCFITMRRSQSPMASSESPCALVYVDGRRLEPWEAGYYLEESLPPDFLESIEFIPPIRAGFRYGTGGVNGVLEIYTIGNGPWVERERP